jgi:O-antigen/teichoic acid export membrane protein
MARSPNLVRQSAVLTVLSGVAAIFSAVYLSLAGRLLGPVAYGSLATLLALGALASLVLAPLETGVAKLAAEAHGADARGRLWPLAVGAVRRGGRWLAVVAVLVLPLLPWARRALRLESTADLVVFIGYVGAWLVVSILRGILRGDHRFTGLGANMVVDSGVRLGLGVAAVWAGAGAAGGMAGYLLGMTAALGVAAWQLRDLRRLPPQPGRASGLMALSGPLFFTFLYFQTIANADVLVARHTLGPVESGVYGACSTIIRLILVAAGPFLQVVFSRVSALRGRGEPVGGLLRRVAAVVAAVLVVGYAVPWWGAEALLRLTFGAAFVMGARPLRVMWLTISLMLLQQLVALALIADDRTRGAWTFLLPCLLFLGLLARFHGSSVEVATCGLAAAAAGMLPLALVAGLSRRR